MCAEKYLFTAYQVKLGHTDRLRYFIDWTESLHSMDNGHKQNDPVTKYGFLSTLQFKIVPKIASQPLVTIIEFLFLIKKG